MINNCNVCTPINSNKTCQHILTRFFNMTLCVYRQIIPRVAVVFAKNIYSFKHLEISGQSISAAFNTLVHSFKNSLSINALNLFAIICVIPNLW